MTDSKNKQLLFPDDFARVPGTSLWLPRSSPATDVTATAAEASLEVALKLSVALDSHSQELAARITDSFTERHLSPKRSNLLGPLVFNASHSILQANAECGALTRCLGETGARVIAVESRPAQAALAAMRCRDLPRVEVICCRLTNLVFTEQFDVGVGAGLFERTRDEAADATALLAALRAMLKPDACLILALDNSLSLCQLAGCPDEVSGLWFDALEGGNGASAHAMSQRAIIALLHDQGLPFAELLHAYPDYRLPDVLLRMNAKPDQNRPPLYPWLGYGANQPRNGRKLELFQEPLLARELEAAGILDTLASSFLVIAAANPATIRQHISDKPVAWKFNPLRARPYMTRVTLEPADARASSWIIRRARLHPETTPDATPDTPRLTLPESEPWQSGASLQEQMVRAFRAGAAGQPDTFAKLLQNWNAHLQAIGLKELGSLTDVPGHCIDRLPSNLLEASDNALIAIDQEWEHPQKLPIVYILFRGLLQLYFAAFPAVDAWMERRSTMRTFQGFFDVCLALIQMEYSEAQLEMCAHLEWAFMEKVRLVPGGNRDTFRLMLDHVPDMELVSRKLARLDSELTQSNAQLSFVRHSLLFEQGRARHLDAVAQVTQNTLRQKDAELTQAHAITAHAQDAARQAMDEIAKYSALLSQVHAQLVTSQTTAAQCQATVQKMQASAFWRLRNTTLGILSKLGFKVSINP